MEAVTKEDKTRLYALDCISQMAYMSKMNIEYCSMALKFLPQTAIKDTVMYYRENQQNWLSRIMKSLKDYKFAGVDIYTAMKDDLDGMPMVAMFDIIGNLKKTQDMEAVATIVEEVAGIEDLSPILTNIVAIIRNEKHRLKLKSQNGNV